MTATEDDGEAAGADGHWGSRVAAAVGREVRRHRDRRDMSAQALADTCAGLGYGVTRSNIANLESGRRPSVTLPEVLVLARALGVPPVALIAAVGGASRVEILPGQQVATSAALRWVQGLSPSLTGGNAGHHDEPVMQVMDASMHEVYVEELRGLVRLLEGVEDERRWWAALDAYRRLRTLRERMRQNENVAPALPVDLEWVDRFDADPPGDPIAAASPDVRPPRGFRPGEPAAWEVDG